MKARAIVPVIPTSLAPDEPPPSLRVLAHRYLGWALAVRGLAENTVSAYRIDLELFCEFAEQAGLVRPDDVTVDHVEQFMAVQRMQRHVKPVTVNRRIAPLREFWKFMRRKGYATGTAPMDVYLMKAQRPMPVYVPPSRQDPMLDALAQDRSLRGRRDHAIIATAILTGLRVSELVHLRLADADLDDQVLRVVRGKGGKDREGFLPSQLVAILRDYLAETPELIALLGAQLARVDALQKKLGRIIPYLFPHPGGPHRGQRRIDYPKAWATACKAAGVAGRIRHDFRRTAVRNLERRAVARSVAMKITGHKTEAVYRRYAIVNDADLREATRKLAGTFSGTFAAVSENGASEVARI